MDAISRKKLWDIMESVRNENRTIVLTTHHLDEAETLADRIAIMSKGRLLALGTNEFIKKNFGIGYQLRITPKTDLQQQTSNSSIQTFLSTKGELIDLIHRNIPEATLNPQTAEDTILFLIPFKSQTKFVNMFQDLNEYEFITINLEMNSL